MLVSREGEIGGVEVEAQVQGSGLTQVGFTSRGRIRGTGRESRGRRKGEFGNGERGEEGGREDAVASAETNETPLVLEGVSDLNLLLLEGILD